MEKMPTPTEETTTKILGFIGSHGKGASAEESNRKSKKASMAISPFHCPEERFRQGTSNTGSFKPQQFHTLSTIQDVDIKRSKTTTPSKLLDCVNRPQRWILAYPNNTKETPISRFLLQRPGLAVSGNAFWPQHSPKSLHKGDISRDKGACTDRSLVPTLPRRSSDHSILQRRVPAAYQASIKGFTEAGIHNQREKIPTDSTASIPMARHRMGPDLSHSTGLFREGSDPPGRLNQYSADRFLHKTHNSKPPRACQLGWPMRQNLQIDSPHNETHTKTVPKVIPRRDYQDPDESKNSSLQMEDRYISTSTAGLSRPQPYHYDRCIKKRLGLRNRPVMVSRRLRRLYETFNKCTRTLNSMVCPSSYISAGYCYSNSVRQHHSYTCTAERRVTLFPSLIPVGTNMEESSTVQVDPADLSHKGPIQCDSRYAIKKRPNLNRVGPISTGFPTDTTLGTTPRSGPLRNTFQPQTSNLPLPVPGRSSSGSGCTSNVLGEVEIPIHVPTNSLDLKSPGEDNSHTVCERNIGDTGYSNETLVHGSSATGYTFNAPASPIVPDSGRQNSEPPTCEETSRVEVIRCAYKERFPNSPKTIDLLAKPIRISSRNDYQRKWARFCSYLRDKNILITEINLSNVLDFFTHLFHDKKLRPGTIAHYRSALTAPLRLQYNIDLHDQAVSVLLKGMLVQRPNAPAAAPSWSLNRVLAYLDDMTGYLPIEKVLQKAAFLILLATGWRISELHACVRNTTFCFIDGASKLMIRPHSSFLAKNESPETRWPHKAIAPLLLPDGSPSNLCPVRSLQDYLRRTSRVKQGCIFIHPSTQKPLSISQLSTAICRLIRAAEPTAKVTVQDIRKYAASQALAETMQPSEVVKAVNWRSPQTFWKFYMSPVEPLVTPAVLPRTAELSTA